MVLNKKQLSDSTLARQLASPLPARQALNWSLVYVDVDTGNINVLSYDNFTTCANVAANLLAIGTPILQNCVAH